MIRVYRFIHHWIECIYMPTMWEIALHRTVMDDLFRRETEVSLKTAMVKSQVFMESPGDTTLWAS